MRIKVVEFNNNWKKLISFLESWKKENLEEFCLNKCDALCCKEMEHSGITENQARLIFSLSKNDSLNKIKNRYGQSVIRKDEDGFYYTDMCHGFDCPALEGNICSIYKNTLKPDYCNRFPFFYSNIDGIDTLEMDKCPATEKLDLSKLKQFAKKQGIEVKYIKKITDI